jgi:uncharacterized protein YrrD
MYRYKDFFMMDVKNVYRKRLGFIKDILLDFNLKKVIGFQISSNSLFSKNDIVFSEDIISFDKYMVVKNSAKDSGLMFRNIKNMEIVDLEGNIVGMFEDVIIDELLRIKAIMISLGVVRNIIEGKKIVLAKDIIIGEKSILLIKKNEKLNFISGCHYFVGGDNDE